MAATVRCNCLLLAALFLCAHGTGIQTSANPIRRVVSMLQNMQTQIVSDQERDKALFEKFMCYCNTGTSGLESTVNEATEKIPLLTSTLAESKALASQVAADLARHKKDRAEAEATVSKGKVLRAKEAEVFGKESAQLKTNIAALIKAIHLLEKGVSGFLQTQAAAVLRQLTVDLDLSTSDRDTMTAFLAGSQSDEYAPQSGEIIGILKQILATMENTLANAVQEEQAAIASHADMVKSKEQEIAANTKAIEVKLQRGGELGVKIETLKEDLDDTGKTLEENKAFLADLQGNCEKHRKEMEVVKQTRGDELLALADTIKILNDDEALDLFKKTLPSPSFIQLAMTGKQVRSQALEVLKLARTKHNWKDPSLDFIALALHGKKESFEKVTAMIDDMVSILEKEQKYDDSKKAYCTSEIDKTEDQAKALEHSVSDLHKAMEDTKGTLEALSAEITELDTGIKALDAQVIKATSNRKAEHEAYKEILSSNKAARELTQMAKNRLNKFYAPKLYKEAPKRELSEEDSVVVGMGGTLAPTAPPGGIAGTGVTSFLQPAALVQVSAHSQETAVPPPPPEAVGAYMKKSSESTGVITLLNMLIADIDKELQEMGVQEKDAQKEYELFIEDSATKRTADAKSIEDKEATKADLEAKLQKTAGEKQSKTNEAMTTHKYLGEVHLECDWLLENFDTRKDAREAEIDSLKKANAVLSGADYSLL